MTDTLGGGEPRERTPNTAAANAEAAGTSAGARKVSPEKTPDLEPSIFSNSSDQTPASLDDAKVTAGGESGAGKPARTAERGGTDDGGAVDGGNDGGSAVDDAAGGGTNGGGERGDAAGGGTPAPEDAPKRARVEENPWNDPPSKRRRDRSRRDRDEEPGSSGTERAGRSEGSGDEDRADRKPRSGGVRRVLTIAIAAFVVLFIGSKLLSCASLYFYAFDDATYEESSSDSDSIVRLASEGASTYDEISAYIEDEYDYSVNDDEAEAGCRAVVEELLANLAADETACQLLADSFEEEIETCTGFCPDELGLDTDAFVAWYLGIFWYRVDDVFCFEDDGYGSVFFYTMAPDYSGLFGFCTAVSDYLEEEGISRASEITAEHQAEIQALYEDFQASYIVSDYCFLSVDFDYDDGSWTLDESAFYDELSWALSL